MDVEQRRIADLERQVETLGVAVRHRTTVGMALGIIMERLALGQDAAFGYLVRCSQAQNRKVHDLRWRWSRPESFPTKRTSGGQTEAAGFVPERIGQRGVRPRLGSAQIED